MSNICILTDNLIQYPIIRFSGQNRIKTISYQLSLNGQIYVDAQEFNKDQLPALADDLLNPHLVAATVNDFSKLLSQLISTYDEVIGLFSSAAIAPMYGVAQQAREKLDANQRIHIIDSRTTSVGLAILVMLAAELAEAKKESSFIIQKIYTKIPKIFTLFNIPTLSYLYYNGLIDRSQAFVGEKLKLRPNFIIEEDEFITTDKMRNSRHITDYFLDFINEFEEIEFVSFLHGTVLNAQSSKIIRDLVKQEFSQAEFYEHKIPASLATLF